jgi:hypothetical protein
MRLRWFLTTSNKIVQVLDSFPDVPTAQGQGVALVQGDFDSKPWLCESCLLSPPEGLEKYPYDQDPRFRKPVKVAQPTS